MPSCVLLLAVQGDAAPHHCPGHHLATDIDAMKLNCLDMSTIQEDPASSNSQMQPPEAVFSRGSSKPLPLGQGCLPGFIHIPTLVPTSCKTLAAISHKTPTGLKPSRHVTTTPITPATAKPSVWTKQIWPTLTKPQPSPAPLLPLLLLHALRKCCACCLDSLLPLLGGPGSIGSI
jgi:hypothetical protein